MKIMILRLLSSATSALPSLPFGSAKPALPQSAVGQTANKRDVRWIEGVRGLAAVIVALYHICWMFDGALFQPQNNQETPPRFWQFPILRFFISGRAAVPLFFIITGYTSSVRAIKLSHNGDTDAVYRGLAKSAGKRFFQLLLPTALSTFINWFLCEVGIFYFTVNRIESGWMFNMTPKSSTTLLSAVTNYFYALRMVWTRTETLYSTEQWCMLDLLIASYAVYAIMLATATCRPAARITVVVGMLMYSILTKDNLIGINAYNGMIMAELSMLPIVSNTSPSTLRTVLASACLVVGLYIASYPENGPELSPWSQELSNLADAIFPKDMAKGRFLPSVGVVITMYGVLLSPTVKQILSHPFLCKLGQMSLGIFLLHMAVVRTVLMWILFGHFGTRPIDPDTHLPLQGSKYNMPSGTAPRTISVLIALAAIYYVSDLWSRYLDPWFAKATEAIYAFIFSPPSAPALPISTVSLSSVETPRLVSYNPSESSNSSVELNEKTS